MTSGGKAHQPAAAHATLSLGSETQPAARRKKSFRHPVPRVVRAHND
jgi:hypothetical protein